MRPEIINSALFKQKIDKKVSVKKVTVIIGIVAVITGGVLSLYASSNNF